MHSYLYISCYEMGAARLFNKWLVSGGEQKMFKLYFTIVSDQRKAVREAKSAVAKILSFKRHKKLFLCYYLQCSSKISLQMYLPSYM